MDNEHVSTIPTYKDSLFRLKVVITPPMDAMTFGTVCHPYPHKCLNSYYTFHFSCVPLDL